jgi:hypothetical protein
LQIKHYNPADYSDKQDQPDDDNYLVYVALTVREIITHSQLEFVKFLEAEYKSSL